MLKDSFKASGIPQDVQDAFRKAVKKYGQREYVTGVDIGWRYEKGKQVEERCCIRVHVREKHNPDRLTDKDMILSTIDGIPTDVIEAAWTANQGGAYTMNPERVKLQDPVQPGLSVGVRNGRSGTLGMMATDIVTGERCWVLSDHVLYPSDGG